MPNSKVEYRYLKNLASFTQQTLSKDMLRPSKFKLKKRNEKNPPQKKPNRIGFQSKVISVKKSAVSFQ